MARQIWRMGERLHARSRVRFRRRRSHEDVRSAPGKLSVRPEPDQEGDLTGALPVLQRWLLAGAGLLSREFSCYLLAVAISFGVGST